MKLHTIKATMRSHYKAAHAVKATVHRRYKDMKSKNARTSIFVLLVLLTMLAAMPEIAFAEPDKKTIGYTDKGGTGLVDAPNQITGSWFNMIENGIAESITIYIKQYESRTPKVKCAIYEKDGGGDGNQTLVGYTEEWQLTSGWDGWKTFTLTTPVYLEKNKAYYLVYWSNDQLIVYFSGKSYRGLWKSATYDGFPEFIYPGAYDSRLISIYATYEPQQMPAISQYLPLLAIPLALAFIFLFMSVAWADNPQTRLGIVVIAGMAVGVILFAIVVLEAMT